MGLQALGHLGAATLWCHHGAFQLGPELCQAPVGGGKGDPPSPPHPVLKEGWRGARTMHGHAEAHRGSWYGPGSWKLGVWSRCSHGQTLPPRGL